MSKFKNFILTIGTFGIWAALLSKKSKTIVRPYENITRGEAYPDSWKKILIIEVKYMIEKIKAKLIFLLRFYLLRDKQYIAYKKWVKENPNEEARYDYYLSKSSLVFDVGGYHGEFSEKIYDKYKCYIHIFEPYPDFF